MQSKDILLDFTYDYVEIIFKVGLNTDYYWKLKIKN